MTTASLDHQSLQSCGCDLSNEQSLKKMSANH